MSRLRPQQPPPCGCQASSPNESSCLSYYRNLCSQGEQAFSGTDFAKALRLYTQAWEMGARHFPLGHRGLGSVAGNAALAAQWGAQLEDAWTWYRAALNEARACAMAYPTTRRAGEGSGVVEGSWRESGRLGEVTGWLSCVGVLLRKTGAHEAALGIYEALLPFVLLPPLPASSVDAHTAATFQLDEQVTHTRITNTHTHPHSSFSSPSCLGGSDMDRPPDPPFPCFVSPQNLSEACIMADLLGNAANAYLCRPDPSSALTLLTPCLALRTSRLASVPEQPQALASTLTALGNAHTLLHQPSTALPLYTQALSILQSLGCPPTHPTFVHLHNACHPLTDPAPCTEVVAREEAGSALLAMASPSMPLQLEGQAGGAITRALSGDRGHKDMRPQALPQPLLSPN